jgi:hypothetical protein
MRRSAAILFIITSIVFADPTITTTGVGLRALGMANNFSALADDFSALFWNPAGMAFVPVREVHATFDFSKHVVHAGGDGTTGVGEQHRWHINSAGLLRAVPTTRGGFAFAIGYSSPFRLDDVNQTRGQDVYRGGDTLTGGNGASLVAGDPLFRNRIGHDTGQLNLWSAGIGWQVAPGLGVGFSVGLLMGDQYQRTDIAYHVPGESGALFDSTTIFLNRSYVGYDARLGLMYRPGEIWSFGCRVDLPRWAKLGEKYLEIDGVVPGYSNEATNLGSLRSPFSGAVGVAMRLPYLTISTEGTLRAPFANVASGSAQGSWQEGFGVGVEVPAPWISSLVRMGYSIQQLDIESMEIRWDDPSQNGASESDATVRNRQLFTIGYSIFLTKSMLCEVAYGYRSWEFRKSNADWQSTVDVEHEVHQIETSLAIRW